MSPEGNILDLYGGTPPTNGDGVKVHTPDPRGYHDPSAESLESQGNRPMSALMPGSGKFGGLRGVIIPHAKVAGGSMGHDQNLPATKVYIDPDLNGKSICVDMSKMIRAGDGVGEVLASQMEKYGGDASTAAVGAYAAFASGPLAPRDTGMLTMQPAKPLSDPRQAPIQMPGAYVVPQAAAGGGQIKPASFTKRSTSPLPSIPAPPRPVELLLLPPVSLHDAFLPPAPPSASHQPARALQPLRRVIFEMPRPMGQFQVYYHDVIRSGPVLVLVYDHSQPTQMVWFPPAPDDEVDVVPIAALVSPERPGAPEMLYRVCPTGITFPRHNEEMCVLMIEAEREMPVEGQ